MHFYVNCSIIYNNQYLEAAQVPIVDEWIKKLWDIYIMECYMAVEKENSYLLQQQGWMDLEIIMLSEISQ